MGAHGYRKSPVLIKSEQFERTHHGRRIHLFNLRNPEGCVAQITNYGARIVSLWMPDREGTWEDVVLGYDSLAGYLDSHEPYFGAAIGRYANRIANAHFTLDQNDYQLSPNEGDNLLHGGRHGFHSHVWSVDDVSQSSLSLKHTSPDGEEGFPGNLDVSLKYTLTKLNELLVEYRASSDVQTPVNLTHHSYFNLAGAGEITDHLLRVHSDHYLPIDANLIPTGLIAPVNGTPMDFRSEMVIGNRINNKFRQLVRGKGYDHTWVTTSEIGSIVLAAEVTEPVSGRFLQVFTNQPGIQFYSGNFLDGSDTGKYGIIYQHRNAFCIEPQHFPNSVNQSNFPDTLLHPDDQFYWFCKYKFGIVKNASTYNE